ncbi:Autotransporter translocation and assembly factor TamB [Fodinibius salinus]|uniref:Autotransporter translocation and assembly factor TamB n=1 Tax=Fodinibius salinus TaxID=860790 RepID=A0A5D3YFX3_9BACT|nr:translocation/assembly module TamB domain-containing protein [Fodinibius salinus]TYP92125.1 Autotransporter translocation and assembly factor TamB [Fodinibius salinus]
MAKQSTKNKTFKKWGIRISGILLGVAVLAVVARLSLKTPLVQGWVKNIVVNTANNQINAKLDIDKLSGDLWHQLKLSGITLTRQRDTLIAVDSVRADYNIWALASGELDVSELDIYRPTADIKQQNGSWDIANVAPSSSGDGGMIPFRIDDLQLHQGKVTANGAGLPDSPLTIADLEISSSISYNQPSYNVDLTNLSFQVQHLTDDLFQLSTSAAASDKKITLQKLVLATGNSVIQSSGVFQVDDSSFTADFSAEPLGWQDLVQVARQMPLRSDLQLSAGISGTAETVNLSLQMEGRGIASFDMKSQVQWNKGIALSQLSIDASRLDLAMLLADTTMPEIRELHTQFTGRVPLESYQQSQGDLQFTVRDISRPPYQVDVLTATGNINNGSAAISLDGQSKKQSVSAQLEAEQLWSEQPQVLGQVNAQHINPGYWAVDSTLVGDISFDASFSGKGWYPGEESWSYAIRSSNSRFMEKYIRGFSLSGEVNKQQISADGKAEIREGIVQFTADANNIFTIPNYNYELQTRNLNVGALMGKPNFNTAINAELSGSGSGISLADLQLQTSVSVDSSLINGELLRNLSAGVSIKDTIAVVDSARLKSTIAEGSLEARMHLLNHNDPENKLSLNLEFKDIGALAPLAGVKGLNAEGKITGRLSPGLDQGIQFSGNVDFSDVRYGTVFSTNQLQGSVDTKLQSTIDYSVDLDLENPAFYGLNMQDFSFKSQGQYFDPAVKGSFELTFSSPKEGRIEQAGSYDIRPDSVQLTTTKLDIISDYRTLSLEQPFAATYSNDRLSVGTMRVVSDQAYLELALPIFSEEEQRGVVEGKDLNIATIQHCLFGKPVVEGMLSGRMEITRKDTALDAQGEILLSEVRYKGAGFNTLSIEGGVENERLNGRLRVRDRGKTLLEGEASLPFRLANPEDLPPSFFDEPVEGKLRMKKISIKQFGDIFADLGITNSTGKVAFAGSLSGEAGNPKFTIDASLTEGELSGVGVDSVTAGGTYNHDKRSLNLDASVTSLKQKAAEINVQFPLFIDLKTFNVDLPGRKDSVSANISTNDFNLAAVDDFLDPKKVRGVKGTLDGDVRIEGPAGDLQAKGQLTFRNGVFHLVPAGIQVQNISSKVLFRSDEIQLQSFSAKSGKGKLTAKGMVEFAEMVPGNINLDVNASNFRAANSKKYSAAINLDSRVRGTVTKPKVSGNLSFVDGFVRLDNFGEKSVETVSLDSTKEEPRVSVYDSLSLDMNVSFNRRFFIRNERYLEMEAKLDGSVELLKEPGSKLQLFGTINTPEGYALPFGKRFKLQEGAVTFTGNPKNPNLMIRTRYEPPQTKEDIIIWYIIEGTVEKPKFKYESQPQMELDNIISYTIFGQPYYALNSWKQAVAGSGSNNAAANIAIDVLLDRVEALATRKLGIDVVKIDNTQTAGDNGTAITTGWYISPKVFFAIQNVITGSRPDTSFLLEYELKKNLKLLLRQGNGIREGIDIKWDYDY